MRRIPKLLELNALSITLFYLIFAILWILLSDQFLIWLTNDSELISRYQTVKGLFYVFATAIFLFYLINLSNEKIEREKDRTDKALKATKTATWHMNLETEKITSSPHLYYIYGLKSPPKHNKFQSYFKFIHPDDQELIHQQLDKIRNGESDTFTVDFRVTGSDDTMHWLRSHGTLIPEDEHNAATLSGVIKDITKQKKLEKNYAREKELFESVFEHIPIMIDVTSDNLEGIRVNKTYEEVTGWTQEEIKNENIMDQVYPDPEMRQKAKKAIQEADGTWHEFENYTKDGDKRIQQWANIQLSDGTTIGIGLDITEQKELERKHEQDRTELQKIYDNIPVLISLYKGKGQVHRVNKHFEKVLGYSNEDLDSADLIFEMIPDREERVRAEEHLDKADGSWLDFKLSTRSGDIIHTTWTVITVTDSLKMGIGLNTTNLKEKERELKDLALRYKNAEKLAQLGHWKRNLETNEAVVSDGFYDIVELDPDSNNLTLTTLRKIIHRKDLQKFESSLKNALKTGQIDFHYRVIGQTSKQVKYIHELGKVEYNANNEPVTINGTIQDITDIKRSQIELQKSRELLNKTFESLHECVIILDPETRTITDFNEITLEVFGYSKEELLGSSTELLHVNKSKFQEFGKVSSKKLDTDGVFQTEFVMKKKNGNTFYSDHTVTLVKNDKGQVEKIVSVVRDITERKKQEKELKKRNEFIETTLENLPIGVAVNFIDSGKTNLMNSKFSEIYGWPQETLNNVDAFFKNVYPDATYRRKIQDMINADIASEDPERMQWKGIKIRTSEGEERIVNAKNIPVYDQNLMISTVVDVTAQAKAEEKLAESEHNYRLLFQKSPQPMWIYNPDTLQIVEVNNAAVRHYGYSRKEFNGMSILDIRPESDWQDVKKDIRDRQQGIKTESKEWRHLKKNGDLLYVKITGSNIDYFGNNYRLILVNDITQQKKAEEMVLASLVEGENKERARIARELHDGLGQYLAAANMNFDAVKNDLNKLTDRRKQQFKKGMNLLKHAVMETSQISRNLLPRVVDDYGLALAIEALIDNYSNNTDIDITYYHNIENIDLDRKIELNLYRIAQEGISNAIKYSEATQINVQLIKDELDLILSIDDNGKGFDMTADDFSAGLGLQTIKTRTGALGGELELESQPKKGTFLHVIVPIKKNIQQ